MYDWRNFHASVLESLKFPGRAATRIISGGSGLTPLSNIISNKAAKSKWIVESFNFRKSVSSFSPYALKD